MDQLIFDSANLLYLVAARPEGSLDRALGDGLTMDQAFDRLGSFAAGCAGAIGRMRRAEPFAPVPSATDGDVHADELAGPGELTETVARFMDGRRRFLEELQLVRPETLHSEYEGRPVKPMLVAWSRQYIKTGLAMFEALPELWDDAIPLTWIFEANLSYDADLYARQNTLLARVRAHLAGIEGAEKKGTKK